MGKKLTKTTKKEDPNLTQKIKKQIKITHQTKMERRPQKTQLQERRNGKRKVWNVTYLATSRPIPLVEPVMMQVRSLRGGRGRGFCKWLAVILWKSISYNRYNQPLNHSIHPSAFFSEEPISPFLCSLSSFFFFFFSQISRST